MQVNLMVTKAPLWIEGLLCFKRHWRPWLGVAARFVILYAILGAINVISHPGQISVHGYFTDRVPLSSVENSASPDAVTVVRAKSWEDCQTARSLASWTAKILTFVLILLQLYAFNLFYLSREPITPIVKAVHSAATVKHFMRTQILFILMIVALAGLSVVLYIFFGAALENTAASVAIAVAFALGGIVFLWMKYMFIGPMAVCRVKRVMRVNFVMSRDNLWRLCLSMTVVLFAYLSMAYFYIYLICILDCHDIVIHTTPSFVILFVTCHSLLTVLVTGIYCAFNCVACRLVYKEKRLADPLFMLPTFGPPAPLSRPNGWPLQ